MIRRQPRSTRTYKLFPYTTLCRSVAAIDAQRDIVLAVANPIIAPASHAGSNILGYGSPAQYRNGQRAMSKLAELEQRHGLREIVGWPIKPLGLYCAVLRPAPGTDRTEERRDGKECGSTGRLRGSAFH